MIEASHRQFVDPTILANTVDTYLSLYKRLYGIKSMIIKFHWLHHFAIALSKWKMLPSCFVLERKHRLPKRYANAVRNTSSGFDASCLREVTAYRVARLQGHAAESLAVGKISSVTARISIHEIAHVNDCVLVDVEDGTFLAGTISKFEDMSAIVAVWTRLTLDSSVSRWDAGTSTAVVIALPRIIAACVYAKHGDIVTVLHPGRM